MVHRSWNKGLTKETHPGLDRIAEARRRKNNFANWQRNHQVHYAVLHKNTDLAELYGTLLGDGCIEKFPRTEKLSISFNSKETKHIQHVQKIIKRLFRKEPSIRMFKKSNCIQLILYQKNISKRLNFPTGQKSLHPVGIPFWIRRNRDFLIKCLKGLFETDGDWVVDKKYGTNVIKFTNIIPKLLNDTYESLLKLGFTAHLGNRRVTISRRQEVEKFVKMIKFRQY